MTVPNAITWFEIPVRDIARATAFYETLLGTTLRQETMGGSQLAVFPYEAERGVGGCLQAGTVAPATDGTVVYLDAGPSIDAALSRVAGAGGAVATPKTALPPGMGFFAHIRDSEGNRVGLHSLV